MIQLRSAVLAAAIALIATTSLATTRTQTLCKGFLPENDMKIPVGGISYRGMSGKGGLSEAQFNKILDRIDAMYRDVVKQRGANLDIKRLWTDETVNASAQQLGSTWVINMYGGLARHPDVTVEGFALVACHEMGHHLGGAPKVSQIFGGAWASNEGESDYFATLKCLRVFFSTDDNASIIAQTQIDPLVKTRCTTQFTTKYDQEICLRISMAGESTSYLFQDLRKEASRPTFGTPDQSQSNKTIDDHPPTQCRMDTYFQGSLCPVAVDVPRSETDFRAGSCVQETDALGWRPRCWFNPSSSSGGGGGGGGDGSADCPIGDPSMCEMICQIDPSQPFCKKFY